MDNIEEFASACGNNKVIEVRRMISEGVNINGVNSYWGTGLIVAMSYGYTEISRILLRGGVTKKTRKFGTMSQLGLTPPPTPTFGTFLNFRHFL